MMTLVVEDERELREEVIELLSLSGSPAVGAGDVASALRLLTELEEPAAILTDLRLPDGSGVELIRAIVADPRLHAKTLRIVVMTGHTDITEQVRRDLSAQGIPMLFKPVDASVLLPALRGESS